jgi:hypothetical protein
MPRGAAVVLILAACGAGGGAGSPDAGTDAGTDAGSGRYDRLSQTGLYADAATHALAADLIAFTPSYPLWSDGAVKRRWLRLPPGTKIDTTDPDHWRFPVGTQFWKEFAVDGHPVETRLIEHVADTGNRETDYWVGAFVWLPDGSDAVLAPDGQQNIGGTMHDAPSQTQCWSCHLGQPGHSLGFSQVQLSQATGVNVDWLVGQGLLSQPPPAYTVPGTPTEQAALGYLHANCGHCHNPNGIAWPDTQQNLLLGTAETTVAATQLVQTTVGVRLQSFMKPGFQYRIVAGDPSASAVYYRMTQRGSLEQMPSLATEVVDDTGVAAVGAWIAGMQ